MHTVVLNERVTEGGADSEELMNETLLLAVCSTFLKLSDNFGSSAAEFLQTHTEFTPKNLVSLVRFR